MNNLKLLLSFVLCTIFIFSQAQEVNQAKYAGSITASELKEHLYIIASDEFEGRETGKEGQKKAERYIENEFRKLGLVAPVNGSYLQEVSLVTTNNMNSSLKINGKDFPFLKDFYFFPGETPGKWVSEDHVFLGFGIDDSLYSDYVGVDVKGKTVWIMSGEPMTAKGQSIISGSALLSDWSTDFRKKRELAIQRGASAVVMINRDFKMYLSRIRYYLESPSMKLDMEKPEDQQKVDRPATIFVSIEMANIMLSSTKIKSVENAVKKIQKKKKSLSADLKLKMELNIDNNVQKVKSSNVLGFLPGTDLKDEVLVLTAHYDHVGKNGEDIFNGADDDGSGTVAILELAEAFKLAADEGFKPRRSILFMTVTAEEKGLLGSEWYTEFPIFPLKNTVANLNIDMIGRIDEAHRDNEKYVYLIGSDKLSTDLHELSEKANASYTNLALDYTYNDPKDPNRFYYRSDHYNFAKNQIPVIFYFSGVHEDYHQPTDTPDKILYDKHATITQLVFHTAWEIANREERLPVNVENEFESIRE